MVSLTYQGLLHQLRPYFTLPILKSGWQYYKDDTVKQFQVDDGYKIKAVVHGSMPYVVQLDLKQFRNSRCNCPDDGYCKHMAAALYEAAYRAGLQPKQLLSPSVKLVADQLEESNQVEKIAFVTKGVVKLGMKESATSAEPSVSLSSKQAASRLAPTKSALGKSIPKENDTAAEWHRYFENQYDWFSIYENGRELEDLFSQMMEKFLPFAAKWSSSARLLYGIHVILFLMKRVDELKTEMMRQHYYRLFAYAKVFSELSEQSYQVMADLVSRADRIEVQEHHSGLLQETADYLSRYAFPEHHSSMPWEDVYGLLWRTLLFEPMLIERERERLAEALTNTRLYPAQRDAIVAGVAFFNVLERQDRQARAWLEQELSVRGIGLTFPLLEGFAVEKDWDRMVEWLQWLAPLVKISTSEVMERYVKYWGEAAEHLDLEKEWQSAIRSMLPESYPVYSRWLFAQQRFQDWVDLNVIFLRSPANFSAAELKQVEAHDGRLLLPLYHFAVERLVMEKNRASYKSATRLLKKLGALYKRLKETEQFDQYIELISKQYSRYRAFQEELRKGKLL